MSDRVTRIVTIKADIGNLLSRVLPTPGKMGTASRLFNRFRKDRKKLFERWDLRARLVCVVTLLTKSVR
jgi:hypothetical protein